jgi:hypothetical protein
MATKAAEATDSHLKFASFNPYCPPVEQGVSYLLSTRPQHPVKGGTGNIHPFRTLLLLQPLKILEAYRLNFLDGKTYLIK